VDLDFGKRGDPDDHYHKQDIRRHVEDSKRHAKSPIHNMEPSRTQRREEMELGINLVWTLQGTGGRGIRGTLQRVWMTPLD